MTPSFSSTCPKHSPAAQLRRLAKTGSAVDALVVAYAEPDGTVLTSDPHDLEAPLAAHAIGVSVLTS